jgi:hypothetical protein
MPKSWPEKSAKAMKLISLKQSLPLSTEQTPSFDWDDESLEQQSIPPHSDRKEETANVTEHAAGRKPPPSRLSNLPPSYWLGQERPPSSNTTLPKCKDRLLNSPFGDHKKLIRSRQLKARQARETQRSLRSDVNKTLPPSLPRPRSGKTSSKSVDRSASTLSPSLSEQLPSDVKKQIVVAERLFGSGASRGGSETEELSPIDQLSYEERLTVMMMQIKENSYNSVS